MLDKIAQPQAFGNYALREFHGLISPQGPDIFALTPAAAVLLVLFFIALGGMFYRRYKRWQSMAYRRQAIAHIAELKSQSGQAYLQDLPQIVKAVALQSFSRDVVASLSGDSWLRFLDETTGKGGQGFSGPLGELFLKLSYSQLSSIENRDEEALYRLVHNWIRDHRQAAC